MSSRPPAALGKVDAIVLAGTRGSKPFEVGGTPTGKPYLQIGGEALVFKTTRAVLEAQGVGLVLVVGDAARLAETLQPLLGKHADRLGIVPEGESLLDNCYRALFLHLLPRKGVERIGSAHLDPAAIDTYRAAHPELRNLSVLFCTADLPFITSASIDRFIADDQADAALVFGQVDHRALTRMQAVLSSQVALEHWKLGTLQLKRTAVRLNNLFITRPLLGRPATYSFLQDVYDNRWLLNQDGSTRWHSWWRTSVGAARCAIRAGGLPRFLRVLVNFFPAALAMALARFTHRIHPALSWPFRIFLSRRDVEFIGSLVIGVKAVFSINPDLRPAFDIDVEESYISLAQDGERDFWRMAKYLDEVDAARESGAGGPDAPAVTAPPAP